jgi:hypothetical protein
MKKNEIIAELKALESSLDSTIQQASFSMPKNYFDSLPVIVLNKIKNAENNQVEDELPAILKNISKKAPYQVPPNYFENNAVKPVEEKSINSIIRSIQFKNITRWVAAAVVIGMVGTLSLIYWGLQGPDVNKDPQAWVKSNIKTETDETLSEFIKSNTEQGLNAIDSKAVASNTDAKELMKDISDNEISAMIKDAEPLLSKQELINISEASTN